MDHQNLFIFFAVMLASAAKETSYCTKKADIALLIDSSSSIGKSNFDKQLNFINGTLDQFNLSPNTTRIAVISFSNTIINQFNFNTYNNKAQTLKAISNVTYTGGDATCTHKALEHMNDVIFKSSNGTRNDVVKIAIVLTDGGTNPGGNDNISLLKAQAKTLSEAQRAKNAGIFVFAIGIGPAANITELKAITSEPKSNFMIHASVFADLDTSEMENLVAQRACKVNDTTTPPPTSPSTLEPMNDTTKPPPKSPSTLEPINDTPTPATALGPTHEPFEGV